MSRLEITFPRDVASGRARQISLSSFSRCGWGLQISLIAFTGTASTMSCLLLVCRARGSLGARCVGKQVAMTITSQERSPGCAVGRAPNGVQLEP